MTDTVRIARELVENLTGPYPSAAKAEFVQLGGQIMHGLLTDLAASEAALQAEKAVSQEHWNFFLQERSECGRLSMALKRIGYEMDLRFAETKGMAAVAREALAMPVAADAVDPPVADSGKPATRV